MSSSFGSLNSALRTMQAMQRAIEVSSHNVANASTPGYSRQKVMLTPTQPYSVPAMNRTQSAGQIGTGVTISKVAQFRSDFVDDQLRQESSRMQSWTVIQDTLREVGVVFNEPSDTGLNSRLSAFWGSWQALSTDPQSNAARALVVTAGEEVAATFRQTYSQLTDIRSSLDDRVKTQVNDVNALTQRIADLNTSIRQVESYGQQPNDLKDQRALLLQELGQLINVEVNQSDTGALMVTFGNRLLVMDGTAAQLKTEANPANSMLSRVVWADSGEAVKVAGVQLGNLLTSPSASKLGGELGGTLASRDFYIPEKLTQLEQLADNLRTQVTNLHRTGYGLDGSTGLNFFGGTGAADMQVSTAFKGNLARLATAGAANQPGDGSLALRIAQLESAKVIGGATFGDFYRSALAQLGQQTQQASNMSANQELLVQHLETRQAEESGVSLDEETVNLLEYQRAYQAAARVMTTVDEMLDTIINRTGMVGR